MSLDWYPFFVQAYRRDTYHLSPAEHHAYRTLIDEYMFVLSGPLPNDDVALARIIGIPKTEWELVAPTVRKFFRAKNDKLYHKRCELELRKQNARNVANSNRGKKAAFARWSKINEMNASRMHTPATLHNITKKDTSEPVDRGPSEEGSLQSIAGMRSRLKRSGE